MLLYEETRLLIQDFSTLKKKREIDLMNPFSKKKKSRLNFELQCHVKDMPNSNFTNLSTMLKYNKNSDSVLTKFEVGVMDLPR